MRADSLSHGADGAAESRLPLVHALVAAALIGSVGAFGTLPVWVLALVGGLIAYAIARRDGSEPATTDRVATLLKLACLLVLCGAAFDNRAHPIDVLDSSSRALFAYALIGAGLWLRRRALAALGPHFSIKVVLRDDHRLVESGPYGRIRHPNYAGLVLVMLGTAVVLRSPLALAAVLLVWLPALLLRIRQEETALQRHLGEPYARYAERTWRLCPGVY
jgi:protein-S-isoprenylcysteine O-methyltransferase Ste14